MYKLNFSSITQVLCCIAAFCLSCGPGKYRADTFTPVIRAHPNTADEYYNLGVAYSIVEREQDAANAFQDAVRLAPDDGEAYFRFGTMLSIIGRNDEAVQAYTKAFSLGHINAKHYQLGLAYRLLDRNEDAVAELEQAIETHEPHPLTSYYTLGVALYDLGKYKEALEALNTALSINPSVAAGYYNVYYLIAKTMGKAGNEDNAVAAYREALKFVPNFIPSYLELGSLLAKRGDRDGALELCGKLETLDRNSAEALRNYIEKTETKR